MYNFYHLLHFCSYIFCNTMELTGANTSPVKVTRNEKGLIMWTLLLEGDISSALNWAHWANWFNCFALLNMTDFCNYNQCLNKGRFLKGKLMNVKMHNRKSVRKQHVRTCDNRNSIAVLFTAQLHNIN